MQWPKSIPNSVYCVQVKTTACKLKPPAKVGINFRHETRLRQHHLAFSNHLVVKG